MFLATGTLYFIRGFPTDHWTFIIPNSYATVDYGFSGVSYKTRNGNGFTYCILAHGSTRTSWLVASSTIRPHNQREQSKYSNKTVTEFIIMQI